MNNKDTEEKYFGNLRYIFLYVICDNMNILVESGSLGALSIDDNDLDGYYMVKFVPSPLKFKMKPSLIEILYVMYKGYLSATILKT